jgi:hypothetical protein
MVGLVFAQEGQGSILHSGLIPGDVMMHWQLAHKA